MEVDGEAGTEEADRKEEEMKTKILPAGEHNLGSWRQPFWTEEQQRRYGVNWRGQLMSAEEIQLTKVNSLKGQLVQEEDKFAVHHANKTPKERERTIEHEGSEEQKRKVEKKAKEEGTRKEADGDAVQFYGQWPDRGGAQRVRVHRHGATKKKQERAGVRRNRGRSRGGRVSRIFASALRIVTFNALTPEDGHKLRDHWSERCTHKCTRVRTHAHTHARIRARTHACPYVCRFWFAIQTW